MKKLLITILVAVLTLTSCNTTKEIIPTSEYTETNEPNKEIIPTSEYIETNESNSIIQEIEQEDAPKNYVSVSHRAISFEQAMSESYIIIRAKYLKNTPSEKTANLSSYHFEIQEFIKGNIEENFINVKIYDDVAYKRIDNEKTEFFDLNKEYILFLSKFESVYTDDSYMPVSGHVIQIKDDEQIQILDYGQIIEESTIDTVEKFKLKVKDIVKDTKSNGKICGRIYTESDIPSEIVNFTSIIVRVKIIEDTNLPNTRLDKLSVETLEILKGEFPESASVLFFKEDKIVIGKEYLVMLSSSTSSSYWLSSRISCIPVSDTKRYEEYMQYINK